MASSSKVSGDVYAVLSSSTLYPHQTLIPTESTPLITSSSVSVRSRDLRISLVHRSLSSLAFSFKRALHSLRLPADNDNLSSSTMNADTRPLPPHRRTYGPWHFIGLWVITGSFNIGGWTTGSSLISLGLNVQQAMTTVIIGHTIVGLVCVLAGSPGAKWHIGFPILQKTAWGVHGAIIPLAQRVMLSFVWYATQVYWGGQCVRTFLTALWPGFNSAFRAPMAGGTMTRGDFVGFILFSIMCLPLIWIKPEKYKIPFTVAACTVIPTVFALLAWSVYTAGSAGPLVRDVRAVGILPAQGTQLVWMFILGVCTNIGGISAHIFSQSDFTRFARRPNDQLVSQLVFVPLNTIVVALAGIVCTSCAVDLFPEYEGTLLWEPFRFLDAAQSHYNNSTLARFGVAIASAAFILAQFGIAVAENALSNGMDLSGLLPRYFNLRRGGYLTAAVAFAVQPWKLLNGASKFLTIMGGYGVFLGSMTGVMFADYYLLRHQRLKLSSLYEMSDASIYWYWRGFNWRAAVSWVLGTWALLPGFVQRVRDPTVQLPGWSQLYYMAWPVGCFGAVAAYVALNLWFPVDYAADVDDHDYFGTFDVEEAPVLWGEEVEGRSGDTMADSSAKGKKACTSV
ncbi:hypothetical protein TD95_002701 [Thielaviopsis punctulata]|uniref:Uracil permease n=1 Tax=Thielaviopsis punctulata TaxID=72032 RepID=A0A0F4Z7Z2_9PEZI|nr:hypothetical protein TD95_002701 [Thielaviopsis punctulata]